MPYTQIFYHLVWSTRNRQPLLTDEVAPVVRTFLREKTADLQADLHALHTEVDHVHMVVSLPPKLSVASFVGQLKAATSFRYNTAYPKLEKFYWQEEYDAFTFDLRRLRAHIDYVVHHQSHRAEQMLLPVFGECDTTTPVVCDERGSYVLKGADWRRELEGLE